MRNVSRKILFLILTFMGSKSFSLEPIVTAVAAGVIVQACPLAVQGYQYFYPTDKQKLDEEENKINKKLIADRSKYVDTREKFRDCLFDSAPNSQRIGAMNCPVHCKELMMTLLKLGGRSEVTDLIQGFDDAMQQPSIKDVVS